MQYTFNEAFDSLSYADKSKARISIKAILGIESNMQFNRLKKGETPLRAEKIEEVENEFKKFGIKKVWD